MIRFTFEIERVEPFEEDDRRPREFMADHTPERRDPAYFGIELQIRDANIDMVRNIYTRAFHGALHELGLLPSMELSKPQASSIPTPGRAGGPEHES